MSDMAATWPDRRVSTGYETAEELAKHYNLLNWRGHPESQRDATEESLDALGYVGAIKKSIQSGVILDGHLRIEIALAKDPSIVLPVDYYDLSPDEEALALQVLDATTEMAEPIPDKLAALLERTRAMTADRPGLGAMLQRLKERAGINGNGSAPPEPAPMVDRAEELQAKWQVKPDDLWEFESVTTPGRFHRLLCGDCTDRATVEAVMGGRAQMSFTSPPYSDQRTYKTDLDLSPRHLAKFISASKYCVGLFVINLGLSRVNNSINRYWDEYIETAEKSDLILLSWNVWDRSGFGYTIGQATAMFAIEHEWLLVFGDKRVELNRTVRNKDAGRVTKGTRRQIDGSTKGVISTTGEYRQLGTIFRCDVVKSRNPLLDSHPAMFPIELPFEYIKAITESGDIVYDPFLGSGTTLIACEQLGRQCRGIEIDPGYAAVSIQRWVDLTGQTPRRVSG